MKYVCLCLIVSLCIIGCCPDTTADRAIRDAVKEVISGHLYVIIDGGAAIYRCRVIGPAERPDSVLIYVAPAGTVDPGRGMLLAVVEKMQSVPEEHRAMRCEPYWNPELHRQLVEVYGEVTMARVVDDRRQEATDGSGTE